MKLKYLLLPRSIEVPLEWLPSLLLKFKYSILPRSSEVPVVHVPLLLWDE